MKKISILVLGFTLFSLSPLFAGDPISSEAAVNEAYAASKKAYETNNPADHAEASKAYTTAVNSLGDHEHHKSDKMLLKSQGDIHAKIASGKVNASFIKKTQRSFEIHQKYLKNGGPARDADARFDR